MSKALRTVFNRKIRDRLYAKLKTIEEFKDIDTTLLLDFINNIIIESESIISNYLQGYSVTIKNIDDSVDWVVEKILIPRIMEMRIE